MIKHVCKVPKRQQFKKPKSQVNLFSLLSNDILGIVLYFLEKTPHNIIIFSLVNQKIKKYFESNNYWDILLQNLTQRELKMKKSKYLKRIVEYQKYSFFDSKMTIRLVFGKQCQFCGCSYGHFLMKSLMIRTCKHCVENNMISNGTLYFRYGLSYFDMMELYEKKGGLIIPTSCFENKAEKKNNQIIKNVFNKREPLWYEQNIQQLYECDFKDYIFFWKPDIERIFGNLDYFEKNHQIRTKSAKILTAACLRIIQRRNYKVSKTNEKQQFIPSKLCISEYLRPYFKIQIARIWIPGGPLYANIQNAHSLKSEMWWRKECGVELYNKNQEIILKAKRTILSRGTVENIFHLM